MNKVLILTLAILFQNTTFAQKSAAKSEEKPQKKQGPTAEQILDRYVEVTGGRSRYEKLRTQAVIAVMEIQGKDMKSRIEMYQAAGGLSYVVTELPGAGRMEQGTADGIAWERSVLRGPRIKTGEEGASSLRESDLRSRINWRQYFPKAELAGTEIVDVSECYKVILTPSQGKPEIRFFDRNTGLLVKSARTVSTQMGEIPAETRFSDYRKVDGILAPFRLEQKVLNMVQITTIEKLNYDQDIPPEKFALPDEIRALAKGK
jgi:hypothetical protein